MDYSSRTADVRVDLSRFSEVNGELGERDTFGSDIERALGGSGSDVLVGSDADNVLSGGAGDDRLDGGLGADALAGGDGRDLVDYAERTADVHVDLDGAVGDDGASGEGDSVGLDVEDVLSGWGDDVLTGNASDNAFDPRLGADTLVGGDGVDTVDYSSRENELLLTLDGEANDGEKDEGDNLAADLEVLVGGSGSDVLLGNVGTQTLRGGDGDDFVDGGFDADILDGGGQFDAVGYAARTQPVHADLDGDADDGEAGEGDLIVNAEALIGGAGNDALAGNAGPNTLIGGPGADQMIALGGKDILIGEAGADTLLGGTGDDGFDGGAGGDIFAGGGGFDVVDYSSRRTGVRVDLDGVRDDGARGERDNVRADVEGVIGGRAGDALIGNRRANSLAGAGGNDILIGGGGRDGLWGKAGADRLYARDGAVDYVHGGRGSDRASVDRGRDIVRSIEGFL